MIGKSNIRRALWHAGPGRRLAAIRRQWRRVDQGERGWAGGPCCALQFRQRQRCHFMAVARIFCPSPSYTHTLAHRVQKQDGVDPISG